MPPPSDKYLCESVVEDGYVPDESHFKHPPILKRTVFMGYAGKAGLKLLDERVENPTDLKQADAEEFRLVEKRCRELMAEHPEDRALFENYINDQQREYEILETQLVCSTMVFEKSRSG